MDTDLAGSASRISTGTVSLNVIDVGHGPAIVMLHGAGPGATSWSNFHQNVAALSPHFRLLLVDQPGFGDSDKPTFDEERTMFSTTSTALLGLLDTLGIEKASLIGNSMGGANSIRFALDHPDRVSRLMLMGPAGAAVSTLTAQPSEGLRILDRFYKKDAPDRALFEAFLRVMVYDESHITEELLEQRWQVASTPATFEGQQRVQQSLLRLPTKDQLWRDLHRVKHPILMTWGRDDRVLPLESAFFALRRFPNARLHVFPRCGHWAQLECRDEFDELAISFLGRSS